MGGLTKLLQNLSQTRMKRTMLLLGMLACTILVFHTFTLPSTNLRHGAFPVTRITVPNKDFRGSVSTEQRVGEFSLLSNSENATLEIVGEAVGKTSSYDDGEARHGDEVDDVDQVSTDELDDDSDFDDEETDPDTESSFNVGGGVILKKVQNPIGGFITLVRVNETESNHLGKVQETSESADILDVAIGNTSIVSDGGTKQDTLKELSSSSTSLLSSDSIPPAQTRDVNLNHSAESVVFCSSAESKKPTKNNLSELNFTTLNITSSGNTLVKKKRRAVPTLSILEMNKLLLKNRASFRMMRPRWSSVKDQQILAMRSQIDKPLIVKSDKVLHEPAFRNLSMFKRSYELMEQTLKVYVYREGEKPVFHQPLLKGIYASEGWFMKLMEGNKHFVVKDPRKAHLFYLPFSSRFLEFSHYVPNSHNRMNLRMFLGNYVNTIAAKYPFWNRTGGTDHFLVACHDWAPFETKNVMDRPIRALCNADLSNEFRLGKDVSLPETYIRFGRDPLRDIGGKPAQERHIFAFYAGNVHGYLRPILLEHWENKDPDMKILGPMPPGVSSKLVYIQYMKNSKYCICPRGYEVNSPRVVEAIFYECVPVIISDNYVPPFFEVLNWEAFSVSVAEADIPKLKDILMSISEEKYLSLQMGVKKVQQHFIWHPKAVKYDLFHMTLHSIWYNRVYTIKPR